MQTIKSHTDLVTETTARVAGFTAQAQEKIQNIQCYIDKAQKFRQNASSIRAISDIWKDADISEFILMCCMMSNKSQKHLSFQEKEGIVNGAIDFTKLDQKEYVESLVNRYFLTCGDSLGGSMRNKVGQNAQNILSDAIASSLSHKGVQCNVHRSTTGKITAIETSNRMYIFDKTPKFIGKSIDIIILKKSTTGGFNIEDSQSFIACGELKGGINPAGADEHWKTARTALQRVHDTFAAKKLTSPFLLFVGAAIEASMAVEIFNLLQTGWLKAAANLTKPAQLNEFVEIMTSL